MLIGHRKTKTGHKLHFAVNFDGHIMRTTILCSHTPDYNTAVERAKQHILTHSHTFSGKPVTFATQEQAEKLGTKNEIYI